MDVLSKVKSIIEEDIRAFNKELLKVDQKARKIEHYAKFLNECVTVKDFIALPDEQLEKLITPEQQEWKVIRQFRFLQDRFDSDYIDKIPQFRQSYMSADQIFRDLKRKVDKNNIYQVQRKSLEEIISSHQLLLDAINKNEVIDEPKLVDSLKQILLKIDMEPGVKYGFLIQLIENNLSSYRERQRKEIEEEIELLTNDEQLDISEEETIRKKFSLSYDDKKLLNDVNDIIYGYDQYTDKFIESGFAGTLQTKYFTVINDLKLLDSDLDDDIITIIKDDLEELRKCYEFYQENFLPPEDGPDKILDDYLNGERRILFLRDNKYKPYICEDLENEENKEFFIKVQKMLASLSRGRIPVKEKNVRSEQFGKNYKIYVYREFMKQGLASIAYSYIPCGLLVIGAIKTPKEISTKKIDSLISSRIQNESYIDLMDKLNNLEIPLDESFIYENQQMVQTFLDERLKGGKDLD